MAQTVTRESDTAGLEAEERELRIQLAAAYRLADKYGLSEIIYTHISLRLPGPTQTYLLNPHGMLFSEITASSLVKVDMAGNIVGPSDWPVNRAGVAIHGSVLKARPDVNCVFHTHTPYTTAVSSLECGLLPMSQSAMRFNGILAYHDYGRAATDPEECARLAEDFGDKWVMLLRNHGGLIAAKTVGDAFIAAFYLERSCEFQILAQSAGQKIVLPNEEVRSEGGVMRNEGQAWAALVRQLDREDPSYRS